MLSGVTLKRRTLVVFRSCFCSIFRLLSTLIERKIRRVGGTIPHSLVFTAQNKCEDVIYFLVPLSRPQYPHCGDHVDFDFRRRKGYGLPQLRPAWKGDRFVPSGDPLGVRSGRVLG